MQKTYVLGTAGHMLCMQLAGKTAWMTSLVPILLSLNDLGMRPHVYH